MIGLTKRSHVAPKMQHVTFCDSIVRFVLCLTQRIDTVCGVTWIPLCAKDGCVIAWGRGEGVTLSIHVVSTQCARGLSKPFIEGNNLVFENYFVGLLYCLIMKKTLFETRAASTQFNGHPMSRKGKYH